jgi:beta-phosphoglucomutase-like phosphatase (HAD superfamily)
LTVPRPELVIFDCDGVLVDSERLEAGTLTEAFGWLGSQLDAARLHDENRGGKVADLLEHVALETGQPIPDWFMPRYRRLQFDRLRHVAEVPGASEALATVIDLQLPRCVVSGGPMGKMEVSLRATGLWESLAPNIFSCYDITDHKPSPGIYLHATRQMGVAPSCCLAIEDSVVGVTAAVRAGVPVIGLARDVPVAELVRAGALTTVSSMHEFRDIFLGDR